MEESGILSVEQPFPEMLADEIAANVSCDSSDKCDCANKVNIKKSLGC